MSSTEYISNISKEATVIRKPRRGGGWFRSLLLLALLSLLAAFALVAASHGNIVVDINGEPLSQLEIVTASAGGIFVAALAIALAVLLVLASMAGVAVVLILIMAALFVTMVLALSPVWLPVVALIGVGCWMLGRSR
ncbi:hypothetical protein FNU76_20420 [Chitinimonas arctica]|uniref:Uncharacterized protein n=1 Tax=Chitinimonas arctica TaxID=2594795 RepID=A0A516SK42_9NEIS|nr:hypothetical protein [Chitinimonas arctica]QDQ28527.1 hypothetical protein FNU76_20420 [Chitinimonas arctica]